MDEPEPVDEGEVRRGHWTQAHVSGVEKGQNKLSCLQYLQTSKEGQCIITGNTIDS